MCVTASQSPARDAAASPQPSPSLSLGTWSCCAWPQGTWKDSMMSLGSSPPHLQTANTISETQIPEGSCRPHQATQTLQPARSKLLEETLLGVTQILQPLENSVVGKVSAHKEPAVPQTAAHTVEPRHKGSGFDPQRSKLNTPITRADIVRGRRTRETLSAIKKSF